MACMRTMNNAQGCICQCLTWTSTTKRLLLAVYIVACLYSQKRLLCDQMLCLREIWQSGQLPDNILVSRGFWICSRSILSDRPGGVIVYTTSTLKIATKLSTRCKVPSLDPGFHLVWGGRYWRVWRAGFFFAPATPILMNHPF